MTTRKLKITLCITCSLLANTSYAAINWLNGPAVDVNDAGIVVGNTASTQTVAYKWDISSQTYDNQYFGVIGVDYYVATSVAGISSLGAAVGHVDGVSAYVWPESYYLLPYTGPAKRVTGINDNNQIVGNSVINGTSAATLWNKSADGTPNESAWTPTYLNTPANGSSQAADINNAGRVAGSTTSASGTAATIWNGSTTTYLHNPHGGTSFANAINDAGQVAGAAAGFAMLWDNGVATTLTTPQGGGGQALNISSNGKIVGYSFAQDNPERRLATLWDGTATIDLNSLLSSDEINAGWLLSEATGVNAQGVVVGKAINTQTGAIAGFAAPVPEPETYALMLGGLGLVGAAVRRRKCGLSNQSS